MTKPVGFDQKVDIKHLDITVSEARITERKDMYAKLDEYLRFDIKGDKSRKNAITMLMKIWFLVDDEHEEIKQRAYELYPELREEDRLALHWGMTLLAYPFFKAVADEMGNLFKLQNEVPSQQLSRRVKMLYGDRRRVEVAVSAVLGSIKVWGVITLEKKQIYSKNQVITIEDTALKNWILEVAIKASEYSAIPLDMISSLTMFFPFEFKVNVNEIDTKRIKVDRQGLDTYMLSI